MQMLRLSAPVSPPRPGTPAANVRAVSTVRLPRSPLAPIAALCGVLRAGVVAGDPAPQAELATELTPAPERQDGEPHHLRWALQSVGVLGLGTVWYWSSRDFNAVDWDLEWDAPSWRRKLVTFDAVRFDSNLFTTNSISHVRAGTVYYQLGRANGLSALGSVALAAGTSTVWEYLVEYKELVSLNDLVVTPTAGFAMGEPMHQLSLYFRRGAPTAFNRLAAAALSPFLEIDRLIDGRDWRGSRDVDRLGLARDRWHAFTLNAGTRGAEVGSESAPGEVMFALESDLVMLPGYALPGRFSAWAGPGSFTALGVDWAVTREGALSEVNARSSTLIVGWYGQDFRRARAGVSGWGGLVGLGSAFRGELREIAGLRDRMAIVDLVGPRLELVTAAGPVRARLEGRAAVGFGMVAAAPFARDLPLDWSSLKMTLGRHGYYYARSSTADAALTAAAGSVDAAAGLGWARFDSIQGYDRYQERMVEDFPLRDELLSASAAVGVRPDGGPFRIGVEARRRWRSGEFLVYRSAQRETAYGVNVGVLF